MMHGSLARVRPWTGVFGAPALLAALTVLGLSAALLWGSTGRYIAWATVGSPVLVIFWAWLRCRGKKRSAS